MGFERYKDHGIGHLHVMGSHGDAAGLLAALDDPKVAASPRLLSAAIMGLRKLQVFDAAPAIVPFLAADQPTSIRLSAARALGPLHNPIAVPALRAALQDPSRKVQIWAVRSLGELKDRESLEGLIARLGDDDSAVRASAARAVGEIGDQRATEALIARLDDKRRTVRLEVIKALVSLRDSRGLVALEHARSRAGPFRARPYADGARRLHELLP
jgi:HEAT repeat protein